MRTTRLLRTALLGVTALALALTMALIAADAGRYDDPTAEKDLGTYRTQFGLPPCTTADKCFRKVNQSGGTKAPRANGGRAREVSLDLDMVSAVCPSCHILLVEATSASMTNLGTAVNTAVKLGATTISNSYGGSESSSDAGYDRTYFNHPGVTITATSGDNATASSTGRPPSSVADVSAIADPRRCPAAQPPVRVSRTRIGPDSTR